MTHPKFFFIGIDVSKLTFDAAICPLINHQRGTMVHQCFDNNESGLKTFHRWLKDQGATQKEQILIVIENTGLYHRALWRFCSLKAISIHIGNATHIKKSWGIVRGKDDRTDSMRLCDYAIKNADTLQSAPTLSPVVLQLKDLWTLRDRLKSQLSANRASLGELKATATDKSSYAVLEKVAKSALKGLEESIEQIEKKMDAMVKESPDLLRNYRLLISVPGIGRTTALYLLCCTTNFAAAPSGKQLACYAGVAPFKRVSGTSVRGKARVHQMGNKELKKLLYMGARSVVEHNAEAGAYYERKLKEGKAHLSIINAIKSKILLRAAAVIRSGTPYVDKTKIAA